MFRPLLVLAILVFVTPCANVDAQGHGRSWNRGGHHRGSHHSHSHQNQYRSSGGIRFGGLSFGSSSFGGYRYGGLSYGGYPYGGYRSSYPSTLFGFSIGTQPYGYDYAGYPDPYFTYPYSYDPWARGSFRAPDLLDDPYFYDRVPAANRYPSSRVARPLVPATTYYSAEQISPYADGNSVLTIPQGSEAPIESLQSASERLLLGLASYGGGDAWIEYLAPDRIVELVEQGDTTELNELMAKYDGVARNQQLDVVTSISGFAETRELLRQHLLSQPVRTTVAPPIEPTFESLPAPQSEPTLESPANDTTEI